MASEVVESPTAALSLEFLVVGGGLGGLSVAYMLSKAGHKVRVLEKLPGVGTPAAGLRVPPNMSKILKKWVGEEELRRTAVRNLASPWWDLHAGECLGVAQWRLDVMSETGGDFITMAHEDVHRLIHRLAVDAGVQIQYGATVEEVNPEKPRPSVRLASGEVISADIIIGADGPRSIVRETVLGEEDEPRPTGITVFGAVVQASDMAKEPELKKLVEAEEWPLIMGTNRSICGMLIPAQRSRSEYSLMLHWPDEETGIPEDARESWVEDVPTNTLNYDNLAPIFQRMMKFVPVLHRTRDMDRDDIDYWIHEDERVVLLGEAAHPWVPGSTHGPSMALEDAVVLGELFRHLSSVDQIPTFLYAYEELRMERTKQVKIRDVSNAVFLRLPPGPAREERNASVRHARDEWDDGSLKTEFEGLAMLFAYDAYDAAAEWWLLWGRYNPTDGSTRRNSEVQFEFASQTVAYQGSS
ncbi:FAD/NAD-P-binding domain-containing protein [Irpex rosettiformis]|uniref:FAD/NAD-P-binding domain-containing protein n=1 Tax=Irpex rosettiformis TaxID=378272 RepID=A0ACB8UBE5_9APHY|nr:FAD/NAD-P-binding domain-containing protein [Irpex rosettiformis]